jgi:D-3-phosphoglycerate dehydrogenase
MKLLLAESARCSEAAVELLSQRLVVQRADLNREGLLAAAPSADLLWVRLRNRIDAEVMDAAPRLHTIITATTGLNHIDLEEAERRKIAVLSLRGEVDFLKEIRATAELTLGLVLSLTRRLPAAIAHAREGRWQRDLFQGNDLFGKTAGIVGYGRLGRIVGDYLAALGMRVLATSPGLTAEEAAPCVEVVSLDELLKQSDLVTLHVNLCPANERFFDAACFARMKAGAWLINTSRGELIDEQALCEALASGHLRGAAVDVLSSEDSCGMLDHPLIQYARRAENLLITPHIGGNTVEAVERTELFLARKLIDRLAANRLI